MYQYFVYILTCADRTYYVGITNDLDRRLIEHHSGLDPKCFTFKRRPVELSYQQEFENVLEAIHFEKRLKGWTRSKKQALIDGDFNRLQFLAECRNASHYKYRPEK